MEEKKGLQQDVVDQFIIEVKLIDPISYIIARLENGDYRDCDIKWLDSKLSGFIMFAAETLGIKGLPVGAMGEETFTIMNQYTVNRYLEWFRSLLKYFKEITA